MVHHHKGKRKKKESGRSRNAVDFICKSLGIFYDLLLKEREEMFSFRVIHLPSSCRRLLLPHLYAQRHLVLKLIAYHYSHFYWVIHFSLWRTRFDFLSTLRYRRKKGLFFA